jgi:hypothetical protein
MPYLGYLLAQAVKAGQTVASAITSATNYVTRVGSSVVELSASAEVLKSPSNGSAVFNGSSDYVQTPILSSPGARTFMYWMYPSGNGGNGYSLSGIQEDGAYTYVGYQNDNGTRGLLYFYAGSSSGGSVSGVYVPFYQWSHLCVTMTSDTYYVYLNGNLAQSGATTTTNASTKLLRIGVVHSAHYHNGFISNAGYWSRNLTASEIRSIMMKSYDDLSASETKGLVSWYALDDISGTTVPDSHGNFNGTAY